MSLFTDNPMPFHYDEDDLVDDVLRDQLRRTETRMQPSHTKMSDLLHHSLPAGLTMKDLQQADFTKLPTGEPILARSSARMANSRPTSAREIESENSQLKRQLNIIREENSSLHLENQQLIQKIEGLQLDLISSRTKSRFLGSTVESKTSSMSVMKEQILDLEADVEHHSSALRDAEQRLEESQQSLSVRNRQVSKLKEELREVRAELAERSSQGQRAEQQRNAALYNAEKLTVAFEEYKAKATETLKKVLEDKSKLKERLIQCDGKREELESRCAELTQETRRLTAGLQEAQAVSAEVEELRLRLEEALREASACQRQLTEREAAAASETQALRREVDELRTLSTEREQRLLLCQREAEESRAELAGLEAILALLHLQEAGGVLCVKPCLLPAHSPLSGPVNLLNTKPGEGYQKLLPILQTLEQEKSRQASLVSATQARLDKAREEIAALQESMSQRASHFQRLHSELLEKASAAGHLEKELKKKSNRVEKLQEQLQEKSSAYSQATRKICELEQSLQEKTAEVVHLHSLLDKRQRDFQQALQKAVSQQRKDLENQVELLQLSLDQKQAVVLELERTAADARREKQEAQQRAESLQISRNHLSEEKDLAARRYEEALCDFEERAAQSCAEVKNLEAALALCREELGVYVQQMEEAREQFEKRLQVKSAEVDALHAELKSSALASQSSGEQNMQLQCSLQRQQAMLQESTARVAELEECQAQMESQVGKLEQELVKERSLGAQELQRREQMVHEATQEALRKGQQAADLSASLTQLSVEMDTCLDKLTDLEQELLQLRRDSGIKESQLSQVEEMLQETQGLLEKKSEMVVDLEEKLHRSEMDRRNSLQRAQLLESQLQTVRGELADTLGHLQELRDVLQRTQLDAEEHQASVERLAAELRESRRELEERNHEVLDMDTALKERQGELRQRALQLGQLDVAIREHKIEMEKKVLHLQGALETSERDVKERDKQVEILSERLQLMRKQLQDKDGLEKEARDLCDGLQRDLRDSAALVCQKDVKVRQLDQELAVSRARELELEAAVVRMKKELETLQEERRTELSAMQLSHTQLLKVSEHISSSLRLSQDQLVQRLHQASAQLDDLRAELRAREELLRDANDALLIKESEVTRLQAKISSYERTADLKNTSLCCDSVTQPPLPHGHKEAPCLGSWEDSDTLGLKESTGDALQGSLEPLEQGWQGLIEREDSCSELSFNPLTYMAEETLDASADASGQQTPAEPMDTFSGMLQFINKHLALQDEPDLLVPQESTGGQQAGSSAP